MFDYVQFRVWYIANYLTSLVETGSQFATKGNYKFVFEQAAKFQVGVNFITLLSATDGLAVCNQFKSFIKLYMPH